MPTPFSIKGNMEETRPDVGVAETIMRKKNREDRSAVRASGCLGNTDKVAVHKACPLADTADGGG